MSYSVTLASGGSYHITSITTRSPIGPGILCIIFLSDTVFPSIRPGEILVLRKLFYAFGTRSHSMHWGGLKLVVILLSQLFKCWDYRCESPRLDEGNSL